MGNMRICLISPHFPSNCSIHSSMVGSCGEIGNAATIESLAYLGDNILHILKISVVGTARFSFPCH